MSTKLKLSLVLGVLLFSAESTFAQATKPPWSPAEEYVLKQVAAGEVANLEERFKSEADRVIKASFLEDLMTNQKREFTIHRMGIQIFGARIPGTLNLANTEVPYFVDLTRCHFDDVFFFQTVFREGLTIDRSVFAGSTYFGYATIMQGLSAVGSEFSNEKEPADFGNMKVAGPVFFDGAKFAGPVIFSNSAIDGSFAINNGRFTTREKTVTFQCMNLSHNLLMENATFSGPVSFNLASVAGNVELNETKFQSDVQFKDMKVAAVLINGTEFSKAPNLTNLTYQNIYPTAGLLELLRNSGSDYSAYTELEKCLQRNGYSAQADEVFIEMKRYERRKGLTRFDALKSYVSEGLQGFGRRPQRVVYYDLGIVLFGMFFFRRQKMTLKADVSAQPEAAKNLPRYNSFLYSLTLFAPTIDNQYTNNWEPADPHRKTRRYISLHKFLGYLLVPLTIAIWSGVFK